MPTIFEQIASHAETNPSGPAVTCGNDTITWRELVTGAERIAAHYTKVGVKPGALVVIGLPNSVEFVQATLAAWRVGGTPTPVSPKLPAGEQRAIIELAKAGVAVGVAPADAAGVPTLSLEELAKDAPPVPLSTIASPCWKAIPSGGSTGRPKLIVALQEARAETVMPFAGLLRIPTNDAMVVPGPLSHNAPFSQTSLGLMLGNHVVLMPRFDASECLRLVEKYRARWLYQVPTMMLRIWRLPEAERLARDLSKLDVVYHMAAPCPPWLKTEWCHWLGGDKILELYSGTEIQSVTVVNGTDWLAHPGTVGKVVLGEMEARDEAGRRLPPGEIGEIWMRRGAKAESPYRYLGATPRSAADGWESLGDNGHFDAEGYLYLADRSTDMILVGGSNVYPAEIEAALDEHPAVRSSCVIGLPHEDLGSAPHALVELVGEASDAELIAWVRERVAPYKVPKSIERVNEPLRDEAGKVRRSQLRAARLQSSKSAPSAPGTSR